MYTKGELQQQQQQQETAFSSPLTFPYTVRRDLIIASEEVWEAAGERERDAEAFSIQFGVSKHVSI